MAKISIKGIVYTSAFGPRPGHALDPAKFHWGADFGPPVRNQKGVPLYAIKGGILTLMRDKHGALGVRIGSRTTEAFEYWHLAGFAPNLGKSVYEGQWLGEMGTTGLSTGIHVHVEHWVKGKRIDPIPYINAQASKDVDKAKGDTDIAPDEIEDDMYTEADRERDNKIAKESQAIYGWMQDVQPKVARINANLDKIAEAVNRVETSAAVVQWATTDEGQGLRRMVADLANGLRSLPGASVGAVHLAPGEVERIADEVADEQHRRQAD